MEQHGANLKGCESRLPDRDAIKARIGSAEATNKKVRANQRYADISVDLSECKDHADHLTGQIADVDAEKRQRVEDAEYPIPDLAVDDDGVLFNELPLAQASGAEQLRVSVALGIAMNPKLRVLLVRDGSPLDETSLAMVAEMAEKADAQVWLERVGEDDATSVVIEDGRVRVDAQAEDAA